jgi:Fic-DOC domain mobile mystery protein B
MEELFQVDDAATPITDDEKEGLIPSFISFRHELNAIEQENILEAERWAFTRKHPTVMDERFLRTVHKRMFGSVWEWAGTFRKTARNIGVDAWKISSDLHNLLEDTKCWIEHTTFSVDEIAVRFHHRLVWIHPFPNGNGRLARLATDLLLRQLGASRFTWGSGGLIAVSETRRCYISALRNADAGDYRPLLAFVRS